MVVDGRGRKQSKTSGPYGVVSGGPGSFEVVRSESIRQSTEYSVRVPRYIMVCSLSALGVRAYQARPPDRVNRYQPSSWDHDT